MTDVRPGNLRVSGGLRAGNWKFGQAVITPVPNTPTSVTVTVPTLAGTGSIFGYATPSTNAPGISVLETSVSAVTATGMSVWIYRSSSSNTGVDWMMWRNRV